MHIVRSFVGVDHFQIDQVAGHAVFVADAVAAQHVARHAGDVQRLAATVALHDRGDFSGSGAFVLHPPQAQATLQAQGDFGLHVGQLLLDQLGLRQRTAELLAVQGVLARGMPAGLGRPQCAPADAVAGGVEAGEGATQAAHFGEGVFLGAEHVVHHDLAGDRGAQPNLAVDGRCGQALPALFQDETADLAGIVLGPDHEHIGDGAVGDPHLGAGQAIAAIDLPRPADHRARIGTVVRLGQTETADGLPAGQAGQVFLPGGFVAEFMDGHHHQRGLHAHHRAVARIDALHLTGNQPVAHVAQAAAAVDLGDGRTEQASFAHLAEDRRIGLLVAERLQHARGQSVGGKASGAVTHHAFFVGELLIEQQRVLPVEACLAGHGASECVVACG